MVYAGVKHRRCGSCLTQQLRDGVVQELPLFYRGGDLCLQAGALQAAVCRQRQQRQQHEGDNQDGTFACGSGCRGRAVRAEFAGVV